MHVQLAQHLGLDLTAEDAAKVLAFAQQAYEAGRTSAQSDLPSAFAARCRMSEQCLPDAPYRKMLTALHNEMLTALGGKHDN